MAKQPEGLADKHVEFVPLIAAIDRMHGELEAGPSVLLRAEADVVHQTLAHELLPHAVGEGRTVFPVLRRVTGTDEIALEMLESHRRIAKLTDELDRIRDELVSAGIGSGQGERMRQLLEQLKSTVEEHFAQEERQCFEVLKQELSPQEAQGLCDALEQATRDVRRTIECGGGPSYG
ncbi:MAG TPA: hemerythrin domain-containing protein [Actinomycetota bacterium]|nr:hemerythrin domain-containing protein [Actinomycetota bacterium]